jgi:steroid delta-isomerase-like uncharacterized protein
MSEENKELARRFVERFSQKDQDVFDELLAPDFVDLTPAPGAEPTREGWKQNVSMGEWLAFPDLQFQIEEQIAEGDQVVNRMTARGTHRGEFRGIPATGKEVTGANVTIFRIAGRKITERWTIFDAMGMMVQLGVVSPPGEAKD